MIAIRPKFKLKSFLLPYLIFIPIFLVILYKEDNFFEAIPPVLCIMGLLTTIFLIIIFTTKYKIKDDIFYYRSFFLFGKIDIHSIRKFEVGVTMYSGIKPAIASKGIIIHFNKYDEIYIAPENNEDFVDLVLKINPEIEVIYPKKLS